MQAEHKVATLLLAFMLESPFSTPWFRIQGPAAIPATSNYGIVVMFIGLAIAAAIVLPKRRRAEA
ncbi:MAG: hypothetical protein IIB38_11400 [Candidatus Hydrogenedentes bacterium]|nr:hypothetical protein [Candidatus Hydrogenedentota bacterium]